MDTTYSCMVAWGTQAHASSIGEPQTTANFPCPYV